MGLFGKSVRPTIEKMKKKRDVKGLIEALGDEDGDVRIAASMALDQMNDDPRVKEALVAALKDEDWVVRAGAAVALATTRDPRAVEALIAALKYEDPGVRARAAMCLGGVGGPSVAAPLIAALKDEDPKVRFGAALALATVAAYSADGDARAVAAVKHAAAVEDDPEMRAAMDRLRFTPPDVT